jgi:hypothetical protein
MSTTRYSSEMLDEKYLPEKKYPKRGLISGDIISSNDSNAIDIWLKGEKSKYGTYQVVEYLGRLEDKPWYKKNLLDGTTWRIQCECGYERLISYSQLKRHRNRIVNGESKKYCDNPIHGEKFKMKEVYDRLTVVGSRLGAENLNGGILDSTSKKDIDRSKKESTKLEWLVAFKCSCGNHTEAKPYIARPRTITSNYNKNNGRNIGCGCYTKTLDGKSKTPAHERLEGAKARAKEDNLPFNIDIDDCMAPTNCPVLGVPMKVNKGKKGPGKYSPTIDKIIPEKGYVKGNVVVMSKLANEIKSDSISPKEIRRVADWYEKELNKRGWKN